MHKYAQDANKKYAKLWKELQKFCEAKIYWHFSEKIRLVSFKTKINHQTSFPNKQVLKSAFEEVCLKQNRLKSAKLLRQLTFIKSTNSSKAKLN